MQLCIYFAHFIGQDATFCTVLNEWKRNMGAQGLLIFGRCMVLGLWGIMLVSIVWRATAYVLQHRQLHKIGTGWNAIKEQRQLEGCQARIANAKNERERVAAEKAMNAVKASAACDKEQKRAAFFDSLEAVEEWAALIENLTQLSYARVALRLTLLIGPLVFYSQVFDRCFKCYDFQAAVTHEIGHVLGLDDPVDAATRGDNIMVDRTIGEGVALRAALSSFRRTHGTGLDPEGLSNDERDALSSCGGFTACLSRARIDCRSPWNRTSVRSNTTDLLSSVMAAFTVDNPATCIYQDDLEHKANP